MQFRPFSKKISSVLGEDNVYIIPNFQRDYSWEKRNYEDFINDVLKSNNSGYCKESKKLVCEAPEKNDYFFGTILLVGDEGKSGNSSKYNVVDGQQRLTTMTLFFSAIKNIIEEIDPEYKHDFNKVLSVDIVSNGKSSQHARLQNRQLNPILPTNILNINDNKRSGANHEATNKSQEWLIESYKIINEMLTREKIAKRLIGSGKATDFNNITDDNYISFIDNFGRQILNSTVISIYTENVNHANILYRNFNYRGIPLSQSDLIKNEVFSVLDDSSESAITMWRDMESKIFSINETINTFLFHYMVSKYSAGTKKTLFNTFNSKIKANKKDYTDFLNDILENSKYYKTIVNPTDDEKLFSEENFFKKRNNPTLKRRLIFLNAIEATQVRIILLGLFSSKNEETIKTSEFIKIVNMITAHQSVHILASSPPNKLTPIYRKYSKLFREILKKDVQVQMSNLKNDLNEILPSLDTVIQKASLSYDHGIKIGDMNSKEKKNRFLVKYILEVLSVEKQQEATSTGNDGLKFIYDATIEHIIDQGNDEISNVRDLGNLILLEASKHTTSQDKRSMYDHSEITMTSVFFDGDREFNSEKDIIERRDKLIKDFYAVVKEGKF